MARRGQVGTICQSGNWYVVRFWKYPVGQARIHASEKICLTDSKMSKGERRRKANEIVSASGVNDEQAFKEANNGTTFRKQADWYMNHMATRKNRPAKPASLSSWASCLNKLNPLLGDMHLADIKNKTLKNLIETFQHDGLSAKTIEKYVKLTKAVIGSALDEEGEVLFPRKWNNDFLDMPVVQNQNQPVFSEHEMGEIVSRSQGRYRVLYTLLASSGVRIGEALGLEVRHLTNDCRTVNIEQSCWQNQIQLPKTRNSIRKIDLTNDVAEMLKQFTQGRSGFIFCTKRQKTILQRGLLKSLHRLEDDLGFQKAGFHSMRRYRNTWLLKQQAPESLIKYWMGHAKAGMTGLYDKVADDREFRLKVAEQIGTGFQVPTIPTVPSISKSNVVVSTV